LLGRPAIGRTFGPEMVVLAVAMAMAKQAYPSRPSASTRTVLVALSP